MASIGKAAALAMLMLLIYPVSGEVPYRGAARIIFTKNRILGSKVSGMADAAQTRPIRLDDRVRVASISKLYVALGVMRLVDRGVLSLDQDVSAYLGWPVRNSHFPDQPITLRLLLSHQSSVSDMADYIIPVDQTLRAKLAEPKAWDAQHAPGSGWFHYANLNFPIIASVMEAATGTRFDALMQRVVMKPLRIKGCFNWSGCADSDAARAITLIRATGEVVRDDLKSKLPTCPGVPGKDGTCIMAGYPPGQNGGIFSPQGGLRISARDLARTGQMLLRKGRGFLSRSAFAELVGPQWRFDGVNGATESGFFCAYGLAVQTLANTGCKDDPFGDGRKRIGHAGEAYGLRSGLWVDIEGKQGIAWFVTAVADDAPHGRSSFTAIEEALISER